MSKKTERNLAWALAAKSQASSRDTAFAQKADHEANPLLARLFRALAGISVKAGPLKTARFAVQFRGGLNEWYNLKSEGGRGPGP